MLNILRLICEQMQQRRLPTVKPESEPASSKAQTTPQRPQKPQSIEVLDRPRLKYTLGSIAAVDKKIINNFKVGFFIRF